MAISQEDIKARIAQIQQAGGGDTAATRAQIAKEAQQYGVTPEQIGTATGLLGSQVRSMAKEAGQAFAPMQMTGGMLGGTNINLTQPTSSSVSLTQPTEPVTVGMLQPAGLDDLPNFLGSSLLEKAEQTPIEALGQITANNPSSIANLGSFIYQANKEGTKIPSSLIEEIGYSVSPDTTEAYNFAVHAQSVAEGYDALEKAIASGDTAKATELRNALQMGEQDFGSYWNYYNQNIASSEGQAHGNLRKETTTGDTIFGVGDPKGGLKGSLERGIVRFGDAIGDVVDNPYVQAFVTFAYPQAGAVLNLYSKMDSNESISPTDVIAAVTGAADLANIQGGQILSAMPESVQKLAQAAQDFADGFEGRAVAALKQAFPNVDTEKLAEYSDNFTEFLAGGEDFVKEVVGEENIEAVSSGLASLDDARRDLFEGEFADIGDRLGGLEEMFAGLQTEPSGSGFTPQRGYQPGLAVDTDFDLAERSSVLDILNQPSSVRTA